MKGKVPPLPAPADLLADLPELDALRERLQDFRIPESASGRSESKEGHGERDFPYRRADLREALSEGERAAHEHAASLFSGYEKAFLSLADGEIGDCALALIELGNAEAERSRYTRARQIFEIALRIALPLRDRTAQALVCRRMGWVALRAGDLRDALSFYQRSVQLAADSDDVEGEVIALTGLGNAFSKTGEWGEAEGRYRRALERIANSPEENFRLQQVQLHINLAMVARGQGEFTRAEEWLGRSETLLDTIDSPFEVALSRHGLAEVRYHQGRFAEARELCEAALGLPVSPYLRALFTIDRAKYYLAGHHTEEALQLAREAERHAIASRSPYALGEIYRGMANIFRVRPDLEGWVYFEKALDVARNKGYKKLEAEVLLDYADVRDTMDGQEEAAAFRERAAELLEEVGVVNLPRA